ncbi:MAG: hypothetical protein IT384_20345 [Deltaproteobacteria bacterium]|nr:hypothetical protein [Deltaproteobacteria bacterium]
MRRPTIGRRLPLLALGGVVLLGLLPPGRLLSHSGAPAQAPILDPAEPCLTSDQSFTFRWRDSDGPTPFGPATIDFFALAESPPTFDLGIDPGLGGVPVVSGISEPDLQNRTTWNTSTVTSGHYLLWSIVREPPQEVSSVQIIELSPQVITVRHGADRVGPSVMITRPSGPLASSRGEYEIRYAACDPTGTARVRIEAARTDRFDRFELLADDLPAVHEGRFAWNTRGLEVGTWTIRATITDACGGAFRAYGRYYVDVLDPADPGPDAGPRDVSPSAPADARAVDGARCEESWSPADGGSPQDGGAWIDATAGDSGDASRAPDEGCSCRAARCQRSPLGLALALLGLLLRGGTRRVRRVRRVRHVPQR